MTKATFTMAIGPCDHTPLGLLVADQSVAELVAEILSDGLTRLSDPPNPEQGV